MNVPAESLWARAREALRAARHVLPVSPDAAASRAYYAAFYAVSALFAMEGKHFRKHTAVEAAVHRDLVLAGLWPSELGQAYSMLAEARSTGDYGQSEHVSAREGADAVERAGTILRAVADRNPGVFTSPEG